MSKVNNYLVTFTEVSTMGFTAKATWPVGSGSYAMNRGEVDTYWYVRQDGATYSAYTNKRYPRYQDLEATTTTSTTSTTTTTTTTTTAAPVFKYSAASANDACTGGLTMTSVVLDNTGLCNSTTITCNEFVSEIAGVTIWISYAGDVREATINDPNTSGVATFSAACVLCSSVTTTTTTTTAAPLNSITYGYDASDPDQACTNYETNVHVTKYNAGNAASANGVTIWNNSDGSGTPTNGYYARGGNVWYSTGGVLGSEAACYAGTTTTTTTATPTYLYLGKATPNSADSATACSTYSTIRSYYSLKSTLASIAVNDIIYDSYPSTPTNGGGNWVALTVGGVGDKYSFQIDAYGVVTATGGNCSGGTTTTTTAASTTTTTTTSTTTTSTSTSTSTTTLGTTAAPTVDIYIGNVGSLDIPITGMTINGVAVTWFGSGPDFILSAGDNGSFTSTQIGTYDVVISYGTHTPGQRISFTDSDNVVTCQTLSGSGGTFTITNAAITAGTTISVEALDGICP
jgi:hypothetical protein